MKNTANILLKHSTMKIKFF